MSNPKLSRFEVLGRLATGGMAEVWLARVQGAAGFEKLVVLKTILPQLALHPTEHYVEPQVLWWAFDWDGAAGAGSDGETLHKISTEVPDGWTPAQRSVLLLDEIDKADPELPNALLEAFGANGFAVPVTGETVWCPPERRPLIVLTTNEERELPSAFLRRCLVLWLALPADIDELIDEFIAIGHEHQEHLVDLGLRKGRCLVIDEAAKVDAEGRRAHAESS